MSDLTSILFGGLGGALTNFLLTPLTTWLQENLRRNRAARSELLALVVDYKNMLNRGMLDQRSLFNFMGEFSCYINKAEIDNPTKDRVLRQLAEIVSEEWIDFFRTCPTEEDTIKRYNFLIENQYFNNENDFNQKRILYGIDRSNERLLENLNNIIDLLKYTLISIPSRLITNTHTFSFNT